MGMTNSLCEVGRCVTRGEQPVPATSFALAYRRFGGGASPVITAASAGGVCARPSSASLPAQAVDQSVEFLERAEGNGKLAHFLDAPMALDALLDPHLYLRGEQV